VNRRLRLWLVPRANDQQDDEKQDDDDAAADQESEVHRHADPGYRDRPRKCGWRNHATKTPDRPKEEAK
jgi:hypothetical protein